MAILPVEPHLARVLIESLSEDFLAVQGDIITIVSLLQTDTIFQVPFQKRDQAEAAKSRFSNNRSDHLTLLNVFLQWKETQSDGRGSRWCEENFVNEKALRKAVEIGNQLNRYLNRIKGDNESMVLEGELERLFDCKSKNAREQREHLILRCLIRGYTRNIARYHSDNLFVTDKGKFLCRIHPSSVVHKDLKEAKKSGFLIFNEVLSTSRHYLKCCTVVEQSMISGIY